MTGCTLAIDLNSCRLFPVPGEVWLTVQQDIVHMGDVINIVLQRLSSCTAQSKAIAETAIIAGSGIGPASEKRLGFNIQKVSVVQFEGIIQTIIYASAWNKGNVVLYIDRPHEGAIITKGVVQLPIKIEAISLTVLM